MASSKAISTGPTNRPTRPMVVTPPINPKKVSRKGNLIGPPTSEGRIVLSTINSSTEPQINSATPATRSPLPTRYKDTNVKASGAPPGISAITPVITPRATGEGTPAIQ